MTEEWMADDATDVCLSCGASFSWFRRRHHCRNCKRIFCSSCSPFRAALSAYPGETVRICISCMKKLGDGDGARRRQESRNEEAVSQSDDDNEESGSLRRRLIRALDTTKGNGDSERSSIASYWSSSPRISMTDVEKDTTLLSMNSGENSPVDVDSASQEPKDHAESSNSSQMFISPWMRKTFLIAIVIFLVRRYLSR